MRVLSLSLVVLVACGSEAGTPTSPRPEVTPTAHGANLPGRALESNPAPSPEEKAAPGEKARAAIDPEGPLALGKKLYSQANEELIIRHHFKDRRDGFFVDVGAGHYRRYSTTYYLEKHLGWTGISVDALGEYAADYEKHRPGTSFIQRIVSDREAADGTLYRAEKLPEVSSVDPSVARSQAKLYRGDDSVREVKARVSTLDAILEAEKVERIDFLSMDIEEHEPAALAGFDIDRFRPELVCIEAHPPVQEPILRYFAEHGYERIDAYLKYDTINWYFRPGPGAG